MDSVKPSHNQDFVSLEKGTRHAAREQLLVLDANLRVQAASESFYTAFQVAPTQTIGRKLADLGNGQWNIPALLTQLNELPKPDGEFDSLEIEHEFPVLGRKTLLVSALRLSGDDAQSGTIILLNIRDTSRQKIEAEAGEWLTPFRAILDGIGYAVIGADPESRITYMNPTAEKLTRWAQNDALQKHLTEIFNIVNEQSSQTVESLIAGVIREGAAVLANQPVLIARDGNVLPIDGNVAPILDPAGHLIGILLVFDDISNRRQTERDLEISAVRYRRLFEAAHDGILILDAVTTKVLDVNPFMADLLGFPREHFLGKELWEIGVFKDAEMSKKAMATLQRLGRIRYEDLPLQHRDGRHIPVEFVSNVYPEGSRNVIQCNIRDITERKRLVRDLTKATEAAEAANRSKSEFLANMSHEIRTPMGAILGFAEMLLVKSPEECAQIGCVQIIKRNSLHLLELINEILDLSKVEAGQMKVERISCDLLELLLEIVSLMRPRAAEKGLGFEVTFGGPIPPVIQSDPLRLRQILVNLLGNAVKFTEAGNIEMRITAESVGGPNFVLRVEVRDSGIGMTPEQLGRLFIPFTQGDASITRKFGGTGLGLTISRLLAKLLNGDITATSQPGTGSTFTLKVDGGPSADVEQLQDLTEASLSAKLGQKVHTDIKLRGRILLVEDGADNQRLLRMQLCDAGASVTSALNGQIAVDLATTQTFDLILMDMQMPVMDGYAATRELRRRGLATPIIALTAHAMAEDRDRCLASGCSGYLSKPIDEDKLLKTVHEHLAKSAGAGIAGSLPPADKATGPNRIIASAPVEASSPIRSSHASNPRMMTIIPGFVDGLPGTVGTMIDRLKHNDLPALQKIAHQLLGTCGGYGFAQVSEPARMVEQSIKAGQTLEFITPAVTSLIEIIRRIDGYDEFQELVVDEPAD
jgi:PAS domain S-box-containing protein